MPVTAEGQQLKTAVKQLLKRYGYTYIDLADVLKVSLPTARRYMSKDDLSVDMLVTICNWLGMSFYDLVKMAETQQQAPSFLSIEQEAYIAVFPHFGVYLRLLAVGLTPREIEEKYSLTAASTDAYLTELEQLNLISKTPKNRIKVKIEWPPVWNFPGPLQEKFGQKVYYRAVEHLLAKKITQHEKHGLDFFFKIACSLFLKKSTYQKYLSELVALQQKYNDISRHEASITPYEELHQYTSLIGIDEFDPFADVMGSIKNIRE